MSTIAPLADHAPTLTAHDMRESTRRIPWALVAVLAVAAGALHLAPYLLAASTTPADWTFTWNLSSEADLMQYRAWFRQAADEGALVSNRFTGEPNRPYIPALLPWLVARTAGLLGVTPEQGCVALGVVLAAVFTGLLTITVHKFFTPSRGFAWVLAALLLGGGLGTHLRVAAHVTRHHADSMVVKKLLREPSEQEMWWDNKRQHYVFIALFDTHFLFVWTLATTCVLALFKATQRTSPIWSTVAAGCLGLMTLVHVYEGVTLAAIAAGVLLVTWLKRRPIAPPLLTAVLCAAASTVAFVALFALYRTSGFPPPDWRSRTIPLLSLLMAYPVAWLVLARCGREYWDRADERDVFLLGWALGCVAVVLSGPIFPYPDRGTMTLQIPLTLIAGNIYFAKRTRHSITALLVAVGCLGLTPVHHLWKRAEASRFTAQAPAKFLNADHKALLTALVERATTDDVLLAPESVALWLGPEYRGRFYCAHPFLTVDYARKHARLEKFFDPDVRDGYRARLREESRARFVFLQPAAKFQLPDFNVILTNSAGTLLARSDRVADPEYIEPRRRLGP